jgi:ABC-type nitrate/sulfonate/bicarbonate transport system permease component
MAKEADEVLLNVEVADTSKLYRFYLNQEKKILGTIAVVLFLIVWELVGNVYQLINPMFMSAPSLIAKQASNFFAQVRFGTTFM